MHDGYSRSGVLLALWLLGIFALTASFRTSTGSVRIAIVGLKSNSGAVLISLYDEENAFPDKPGRAARTSRLAIHNNSATETFRDLPFGRYAAAILHDENDNHRMDYNLMGFPKEGYGFTNNAIATFGPPSFSQAAFSLDAHEKSSIITTRYFPIASN